MTDHTGRRENPPATRAKRALGHDMKAWTTKHRHQGDHKTRQGGDPDTRRQARLDSWHGHSEVSPDALTRN
jgi:hypothetical protein